jgi:3-hydroxybutyryl-CoA dehydrogenase
LRVQLYADEPYFKSFSDYLSGIRAIELVAIEPELVLGFTFLDPDLKMKGLSQFAFEVPILSNALTMSATTAQHAAGQRTPIIGMPVLPHYFERQKSVEFSFPITAPSFHGHGRDPNELVTEFLFLIGKTGEEVKDSVGGVFPRTLAMIINEAAFAVQESVATAADIDTAMKLGTNYPKGPLAWCDEIGAEAIVAVLDALAREYGSDRYRVATLLRRHAESGQPFILPSHAS